MSKAEEPRRRTLYVSSVVRAGCTLEQVNEALARLAGLVRRQEEACASAPSPDDATIDATFHLPGTNARPDFEGVRTGRWVKAERLLVVQIAVPQAAPGDRDAVAAFVRQSLLDAIDAAAGHLTKRGLPFSVERARCVATHATALLT